MILDKFIEQLIKLQSEGHGNLEVFYRHGASSDCGELSYPNVTDKIDSCGPFDLEKGENYISVYAGN